MSNDAYQGPGTVVDGNSEYNRLAFLFKQLSNGIATAIPAKVLAVNGDKVDAQPAVHQSTAGGEAIPHGSINDLPILRLRAGSSAIIMTPVVGDIGLVIFCHSDISSVKANKGVANPGSRRKFDYADGIYIGGMYGPEPTQTITFDDGGITLTSGVKVTVNAPTDIVGNVSITGNMTVSGTASIGGKDFATHKHTGVATGGGVSGPVQ